MSAAQRAIATRGLGALRLKDVADEAGVTGPAVSYYYPDLDELLVDVYERHIDAYIAKAPQVLESEGTPWQRILAAIDQDLPTGPDDIDSIIMYQFSGEPRFNRTYRRLSSSLRTCQTDIYASLIESGIESGDFEPRLDTGILAEAIVALADAYGLQVVIGEPGMTRDVARTTIGTVTAELLGYDAG